MVTSESLTAPVKAAASSTPNGIATVMGSRQQTWAELQDAVSRLAGGLLALGVASDDRVAILSMNSDRYAEALLATWWAGACAVPVNIRWTASEMIYSLNDCSAAVLFVDNVFAELCPAILEGVSSIKHVIRMDDASSLDVGVSMGELRRSGSPARDAGRSGEDLAGVFYTGGTTGFPKGVMLTHRAQCSTAAALKDELRIGPDSVYLHAAPMFHVADAAAGGAAMSTGATNVYIPSFSTEGFQETVKLAKVTHSLLVPTMIGMLLEAPEFSVDALQTLETLLYGASPMPRAIVEQALEKLPSVSLVQGYGQTESVPITVLPADHHRLGAEYEQKLRSAGRPAQGVQIRILGEDGGELPTHEVGEIAVHSAMNMKGYWNAPEQTQKTLIDGWVHTGDGGFVDEDGFLYIVDRMKDMIVTGGENVYSAEVESAVSTHEAVEQVAVIGIPSEEWGEAVHAVVVKRAGVELSIDDLKTHCKGKISNYKIPRSLSFHDGALPLSAAGKVLKRELRQPFWESADA
ncbi:MAG: long-chain-fatty-acid--CoA ligase [Pseudomonadota bacterium]